MTAPSQRRALYWIAGAFIAFIVFGNQGFRDMAARTQEKKRLVQSLSSLRTEHDRLGRELGWLKQDPGYSEYLIRKSLGYVKKGEVEYRFLRKEGQKK